MNPALVACSVNRAHTTPPHALTLPFLYQSYAMPGKQKPASSSSLPKNWPHHLQYLKLPSYSPTLSAEDKASLRTEPQDVDTFSALPQNLPKGPYPAVKIIAITDPAHPACGQAGLFATKDLKPGSFILEYLGVIHHSSVHPPSSPSTPVPASVAFTPDTLVPGTASPRHPTPTITSTDPHAASDYDLSLDRTLGLAIDAAVSGNEARFINDYRGVGARPNAEFREVWSEARRERGMGVWVLPVGKGGGGGGGGKQQQSRRDRERGVVKGEEILVSYGRGFWGARKGDDNDGGVG